MRRPAASFPLLAALLACALALAGCGPTEAPPSAATFPVRLLPADEVVDTTPALLRAELGAGADLADWWVAELSTRGAAPAADHLALVRDEAGVSLAEPSLALLRLVDVPARTTVSLEVRLAVTGDDHDPTGPCPQVLLLTLDGPPFADESLAAAALAERLGQVRVVGEAGWISLPDASGFARARVTQAAQPDATTAAVVLAGGARHAEAALRPRQQLARAHDTGARGDGADPNDPVVAPVEIGGERRPALLVPAGVSHDIEVDVPAATEAFAQGVTLSPGTTPGDRARWSVKLLPADGEGIARPLANGELLLDADSPHAWSDVSVPWPADLPAGPATLRFAVEGERAVAFGQPMLLGPPPAPRESRHPNLLLVSLDTLRADHLSHLGYPRPTSPRLDALAADGVTFLDAASVGPYTLPTHATLLSGWLPLHHGVVDSGADRLDASAVPYLPARLADAGYATAAFTGGGFLSAAFGFAAGFDRFSILDPVAWRGSALAAARYARGTPRHLDELERRAGLSAVGDWIEAQGHAPWFALVHTYAVHDYAPPPADLARFDRHPDLAWGRDPREVQRFLNPDVWPSASCPPERVERLEDLYDATLAHADRELGALLDRLAAGGALQHTVVVVTSDHGEEFGEHGGLRHSHTLYQEMLHVPLIVRAPGGARGRRVREPVSLADVVPTVLELLGLPAPEALDGRSLASLVRGGTPDAARPSPRVGHVHTLNSQRASLQAGSLKLIRGEADPDALVRFKAEAPWELYDLASDPGETENLAARREGDRARLADALSALEDVLRAGAARTGTSELPPEVLAQLRELGYLSAGDEKDADDR